MGGLLLDWRWGRVAVWRFRDLSLIFSCSVFFSRAYFLSCRLTLIIAVATILYIQSPPYISLLKLFIFLVH
jgi:hypothetical protein